MTHWKTPCFGLIQTENFLHTAVWPPKLMSKHSFSTSVILYLNKGKKMRKWHITLCWKVVEEL